MLAHARAATTARSSTAALPDSVPRKMRSGVSPRRTQAVRPDSAAPAVCDSAVTDTPPPVAEAGLPKPALRAASHVRCATGTRPTAFPRTPPNPDELLAGDR